MNNILNSPVVTPEEFQLHVDKVWKIAFAWMHDDKVWWPSHEFYAYDIFTKLKNTDTQKIYQDLVKVVWLWRVKAYVWNFRKVHRQYMKEWKWQAGIKSVATREAYMYVRQLQESNFKNDQKELKKHTSQEIVSDLLASKRVNNWTKILSTISPSWDEWWNEENNHILSQRSTWEWKQWLEYGTNVAEIDGEIVNPHDLR